MKGINFNISKVNVFFLCFIINCINFFTLQISTQGVWYIFSIKILYAFINLGIIYVVVYIFYVFINKLWVSEMICSIIFSIYAIINVYVVEFHGTPLTIPEFANTKTAINVLHGYSVMEWKPLFFVAVIIVLFIINNIFIWIIKRNEEQKTKKNSINRIVRIGLCILIGIFYIGAILQSESLVKPLRGGWHFKERAGLYGYPFYFLVSGLEYEIEEPQGYSEEELEKMSVESNLSKEMSQYQKPDIFLILNESFYDISLVSNIETDLDCMDEFYSIENSISGHAVVPKIGGGTNRSEYELLTSNSTNLFPEITPFQTLDLSESSSIISNLKELGYYTMSMHPADSSNYARKSGYPLLGFDEIHFEDDFTNKEYYGERMAVTDECAYNYMIEWYKRALEEDKPIFSYMLTIQNHGDWNRNAPDIDTVHVQNYNNKSYEEKLNEYLSCISLSVDALNDLIEYFKNSERPVILCMVGDHSPSFIGDIADDDSSLLQRATPFIIWANFPIEEKKDVMVSMNQLGPLLLETAEVEMMPYYRYLLQLGKDVPILTNYGEYVDKDGNVYSYTDDTEYSDAIQKYFWLEYNNLQEESINEWFSVK